MASRAAESSAARTWVPIVVGLVIELAAFGVAQVEALPGLKKRMFPDIVAMESALLALQYKETLSIADRGFAELEQLILEEVEAFMASGWTVLGKPNSGFVSLEPQFVGRENPNPSIQAPHYSKTVQAKFQDGGQGTLRFWKIEKAVAAEAQARSFRFGAALFGFGAMVQILGIAWARHFDRYDARRTA